MKDQVKDASSETQLWPLAGSQLFEILNLRPKGRC